MATLIKKPHNPRIAGIPLVRGLQDMRGCGEGYENAFPSAVPLTKEELSAESQQRRRLESARE